MSGFTEEIIGPCRLILGDCRDVLPALEPVDQVITDPPYGETSLDWDTRVKWQWLLLPLLRDHGSLWCFGSMRFFMETAADFTGWSLAQDLLWEKHNGTNLFNDRFRRVHEQAVQFYKEASKWDQVIKHPLFTNDAVARTVRRKKRPTQWGAIGESSYVSHDGGPKLMRSVMFCRSCHGNAIHPTRKPVEVVLPLIEYSTDAGATVLDPMMGSATTGVACIETARNFIGIEKDEHCFERACRRIRNVMRDRRSRLPLDLTN